jgi:polar amino acid transport system substrate-binding protein
MKRELKYLDVPNIGKEKSRMKPIKPKRVILIFLILSMGIVAEACGNSVCMGTKKSLEDHLENTENEQKNDITAAAEKMNTDLEEAPDIKRILDRGKLLVGVYAEDMPPFFMTNQNGKLIGYDINVANKMAESLHVGIAFDRSSSTYQKLFEKAARGKVDIIISKFSVTYDRAMYVRFTEPYLEMHRALLVNREFALKNKIEEYPVDYLKKNKVSIGVKSNTSYVSFAKELFPNARLVTMPEWNDAVGMLVQGKIDAAMYDELEVKKLLKKNPDISLYASVYILKDQKDLISMAVPYKSTQLLSWINWFMKYQNIETNVNALIKNYPEAFTKD